MVAGLIVLRDKIDEADKVLFYLLAKRQLLIAEIGELKSCASLSIYASNRETTMLASRRHEALALDVPSDLIEDVLCCVRREPYARRKRQKFQDAEPTVTIGDDH